MSTEEIVKIGQRRKRGCTVETDIHDLTRVGNPVAAKIYDYGGRFFVVPENNRFDVVGRWDFSSAVSYVEQIIPDEGRRPR